mgnify:CR=1 FL=1
MNVIFELLKSILYGIVEGITEWLPISSTGHMLLVDEFLQLEESAEFKELFFVVIQLGAILAVPLLFWDQMTPLKNSRGIITLRRQSLSLWLKVILACIPGAVVTLLFDNALEGFLGQTRIRDQIPLMPVVIASALLLYGALFILIERKNKTPRLHTLEELRFSDAFFIGLFQALSIIPGTSRSGSTVVGALALGISRPAAAEFSFFLAVPVMLGYSLLKLLKFGFAFTLSQFILLLIGAAAAFLTSLIVIRTLMSYVQKHSFSAFGIYRILLGTIVLLYFLK